MLSVGHKGMKSTNNAGHELSESNQKKYGKKKNVAPPPVVPGEAGVNVMATSSNYQMFGMSKYMAPAANPELYAELQFKDFAPCTSCPMICCQCLVPEAAKKRFYARVFENRLEYNIPNFPCLCCTTERCVSDCTSVQYFDKPPTRAGMCCYCIPCICCGPPVVYAKVPRWCCGLIDCRPCFGEVILRAPCNCFDCRTCLCCGSPCYGCCACPLFAGTVASEEFLAVWRAAMEDYADTRDLPKVEMARFRRVADRGCNCDQILIVDPAERPLKPLMMDRGRDDDHYVFSSVVVSSGEPAAMARAVGMEVMEGRGKMDGNVELYDDEPLPKKKKKKKKRPTRRRRKRIK
mmetsp:Transcript_21651/g.60105  ORF Transcript_21651/g.60105 Transcript_21651/m.60105 type:complete len:348 (-) Transcript_21651:43-1086(-)